MQVFEVAALVGLTLGLLERLTKLVETAKAAQQTVISNDAIEEAFTKAEVATDCWKDLIQGIKEKANDASKGVSEREENVHFSDNSPIGGDGGVVNGGN